MSFRTALLLLVATLSFSSSAQAMTSCKAVQKALALAKKHQLSQTTLGILKTLYCKGNQQDQAPVLRLSKKKTALLKKPVLRKKPMVQVVPKPRVRRGSSFQSVTLFGNSDACSGDPIMFLDDKTDCTKLSKTQKSWSVRVAGICNNSRDTTAQKACFRFRSAAHKKHVRIYRSDNCTSGLIAIVHRNTDCGDLGSDDGAWSVKYGGKCRDITDTTLETACEKYKNASLK